MHNRLTGRTFLLLTLLVSFGLFLSFQGISPTKGLRDIRLTGKQEAHALSGAFSRFPTLSNTPIRFKRLTILGLWFDDNVPTYLRHFFYTAQMNADSIDLVLINRKSRPDSKCADFEAHGIDISWGGNVKIVCMEMEEWKARYLKVMCSTEHGWGCNTKQFQDVKKKFEDRKFNWRPLRGLAFRDLFINPENPLWAWVDHDLFMGRFTHFPFNLMSQLSIATFHKGHPDEIYLAGQLSVFNLEDEYLSNAWKTIPTLLSPEHFTQGLLGQHPHNTEEGFWSSYYLNVEEGKAGSNLSYAVLGHSQGDDWDLNGNKVNAHYILSGRDVIRSHSNLNRREIEDIIRMERLNEPDQLGGYWSEGVDGSEKMISDPSLSQTLALKQVFSRKRFNFSSHKVFTGWLETIKMKKGQDCYGGNWFDEKWRICASKGNRAGIARHSFVHFREQAFGVLFRRTEQEKGHSRYERRLVKHHQNLKKRDLYPWFDFPNFDIDESKVLVISNKDAYVFKMGPSRDINLWRRSKAV